MDPLLWESVATVCSVTKTVCSVANNHERFIGAGPGLETRERFTC